MTEHASSTGGGPIRSYVLARGRSQAGRTLALETLLQATGASADLPVTASREHRALWRMCQDRLALAETAAYLGQPVSVVTVLADDLIVSGHLLASSAVPRPRAHSDAQLLKEVLDGLRRRLPA